MLFLLFHWNVLRSRIVRTKAEKCSTMKSNYSEIDEKSSVDRNEENSSRNSSDEIHFHSHPSFQPSTSNSTHLTNSSSTSSSSSSTHYPSDWNQFLDEETIYDKEPSQINNTFTFPSILFSSLLFQLIQS